jgi:hypothetical protein
MILQKFLTKFDRMVDVMFCKSIANNHEEIAFAQTLGCHLIKLISSLIWRMVLMLDLDMSSNYLFLETNNSVYAYSYADLLAP